MIKTLSVVLFFSAMWMLSAQVNGQSLAYRTLLKAYYDTDFPIVYPENEELLQKAVLLDTRERSEYEVSHLQDAKWVGYESFEITALGNTPKDTPLVVYCSIGARSQDIGKRLKQAGFQEVYNLYGGIFHWVNEGLPVYDKIGPTRKVHAYSRSWGIWVKNAQKVY
ncbi:rhodanese-like domain-containing protein [Lunatimonas salinarum]|uniref:rhodanese-like domain-containing protein n=1 Tax=Lunatimonas salinarum TaxID=1774590 RepID=UPI001AE000D9|nr:rhodanese-like domain-containing protein [Lunatimonas salinarum]